MNSFLNKYFKLKKDHYISYFKDNKYAILKMDTGNFTTFYFKIFEMINKNMMNLKSIETLFYPTDKMIISFQRINFYDSNLKSKAFYIKIYKNVNLYNIFK